MKRIDLHRILKERIGGWKGRLIPGALITLLENLVHQDELNAVLEATDPSTGSEFCRRTYDYFGLTLDVYGLDNLEAGKRYVFASNHPLGGLDGIGLIKVLGSLYGDGNITFLVNDMLMNVEPLRDVFLPINKYGRQGRQGAIAVNKAYAGDGQILIFPAGLVSRLQPDGTVADLAWQKSFIAKALESHRDIVPVYFQGLNRPRFYRLAKWRRKLGVRFNIEQIFLPAEVCASKGKHFSVFFGKPIPYDTLRESNLTYPQLADLVRKKVYDIPGSSSSESRN